METDRKIAGLGLLCRYANTMAKFATDVITGEGIERAVRFLKGYTVSNIKQIDSERDGGILAEQ